MGVILQNKHFTGVFRNWLQQPGSPKPWGQDSLQRAQEMWGEGAGLCPSVGVGYGGSGGTAGPSACPHSQVSGSHPHFPVPEGRVSQKLFIFTGIQDGQESWQSQRAKPALAPRAPQPVPSLWPGNVTWNPRIP